MSNEHHQPRAPRHALALSAEVRTKTFRTAGVTRNVSIGGVCVEIDRAIAEGELLEVTLFVVEEEIEAEGKRGLDMRATVQWTAEGDRGHSIGLRFFEPEPEKIAMLERVLKLVE